MCLPTTLRNLKPANLFCNMQCTTVFTTATGSRVAKRTPGRCPCGFPSGFALAIFLERCKTLSIGVRPNLLEQKVIQNDLLVQAHHGQSSQSAVSNTRQQHTPLCDANSRLDVVHHLFFLDGVDCRFWRQCSYSRNPASWYLYYGRRV